MTITETDITTTTDINEIAEDDDITGVYVMTETAMGVGLTTEEAERMVARSAEILEDLLEDAGITGITVETAYDGRCWRCPPEDNNIRERVEALGEYAWELACRL
jgi:hypothetical protein